jgi:ankyrin repeat protein
LLLANKAEVDAKTHKGWTALHWAADRGHRDVVGLLLANRADVNAKTERCAVFHLPLFTVCGGWTPLHYAEAGGHPDVAEVLREHGGRE